MVGVEVSMGNFYKHNDEVHYFDDWQDIPDGMTLLTPEEVEAHLNPVLSDEELAQKARAERDSLIEAIDWRLSRYERQERLGIETTDTAGWYQSALQYTQDLRDVPQQEGFPHDIVWPILEE